MIRIGSVEDAVLEPGTDWSAEWAAEATSTWTGPLVPRQRGSVESGSTTS